MSIIAHAPTLATAHLTTAATATATATATPARLMATAASSASAAPSQFLTTLSQTATMNGTQSAVNALSLDQLISTGHYPSIVAGNSVTPLSIQPAHSYVQTSSTATWHNFYPDNTL
jgi:hypothetical protein